MSIIRKITLVILGLVIVLTVVTFIISPIFGIIFVLGIVGLVVWAFRRPAFPEHLRSLKRGHSPLHTAVYENDIERARELIKQGANFDLLNEHHYAPLHIAAVMGHDKIIKLFIEAGANLNIRTAVNSTPLHATVWCSSLSSEQDWMLDGQIRSATLLLDAGADPNVRDLEGRTALDAMGEDTPLFQTPLWWRLHDLENKASKTSKSTKSKKSTKSSKTSKTSKTSKSTKTAKSPTS